MAQDLALLSRQQPWLAVDDAQGADIRAIVQMQRHAGIKADAGRPHDERVVRKTRVERGVRHLEQRLAQHRVRTKGHVAIGLRHALETHVGLEPRPIGIDQADQRDGRAAHERGGLHERIELRFGRAVENMECAKRFEAADFVVSGSRDLHSGGP